MDVGVSIFITVHFSVLIGMGRIIAQRDKKNEHIVSRKNGCSLRKFHPLAPIMGPNLWLICRTFNLKNPLKKADRKYCKHGTWSMERGQEKTLSG